MSDLHLEILKTQLDRFHSMLESSLPEDDEYWIALQNIERIMNTLCPQEDPIDALIEESDIRNSKPGAH